METASFHDRLRAPRSSEVFSALQRARNALAGEFSPNFGTHASMFDPDVISFAHGEGVRRPYPQAIRAMIDALGDPEVLPVENYLFLQRIPALEAAISSEFQSVGVPPSYANNVVVDAGTTRLICAALDLMTRPGDTVVTFSGFYHPLASWCAYRDLDLHIISTSAEEDHRPSAAKLSNFLKSNSYSRPPILVLFNPGMTGAVCEREEIIKLAQVVSDFEMWVIEDALFATCEFDDDLRSARLSRTQVGDRVLTVGGASKLHGLANMRIGWGCGEKRLVDQIQKYIIASSASIPKLSKIAAQEVLLAHSDYKRRNIFEVKSRLRQVMTLIDQIDSKLRERGGYNFPLVKLAHKPYAGHSLLIDFNGFVSAARRNGHIFVESSDLTRFFLCEGKVALAPAQSHGFSGFQLRLNVASVGTNFTYSASRGVEANWAGVWRPEHGVPYEEGFGLGRALIASGLLERMEPAMARALFEQRSVIGRNAKARARHRVDAVLGFEQAADGCVAVLMDVWGVLTDGERIFDGAHEVLDNLSTRRVPVVLISNTSRRGDSVRELLGELGLSPNKYGGVMTGGDLAYRCARERRVAGDAFGSKALVLGEQPGGHWALAAGLELVDDVEDAEVILGVGVMPTSDVEESYRPLLRRAAARGLPLILSNADEEVRVGDELHTAVGALARHYRSFGGKAHAFGKPHRQIYEAAFNVAADQSRQLLHSFEQVLVVGDSLKTDIHGGAALGARTLLITRSGIHGPELFDQLREPASCDLEAVFARYGVWPNLVLEELRW